VEHRGRVAPGLELSENVALAEWLRRVPAKYMGFPRKSSNLLGDGKMNIAATFLFQSSKSYFTVFVLLKNSE
jgi:hypothetical protein